MSKVASHLKRARALLVALALVAAVAGTAAPANASHAGLMTLRGKVTINGYAQPNAVVYEYYWTGSEWTRLRQTTTDASGNYAIVAGREHWYYLQAVKTVGTYCQPYGGFYRWDGYTGSFFTEHWWPNPKYINIAASFTFSC